MMSSDDRLAMMRELHDTVTHCLSTVALQVMVAETQPAGASRVLMEIRRLTQEALTALGLVEKLLQSVDAPAPQLNTSALWLPTVAASEKKVKLDRHRTKVHVAVPREADRLDITSRYVLVLAINLALDHVERHLPIDDPPQMVTDISSSMVQFSFQNGSASTLTQLPPPPHAFISRLQARADPVGGRLHVESDPNGQHWRLILTLPRNE